MLSRTRQIPLDSVRTDGWFERIGESIGSFQALCEILGEAFFAFAMITGARITSLTVDRRNPNNTLVDFTAGPEGEPSETQRLTLGEFRQRLVGALVTDDDVPPPPQRPDDVEALQLHIGVRYLLLAPLYGYHLRTLVVDGKSSHLRLLHEGEEETHSILEFRARVRAHVRDELERLQTGARSAIDLSKVLEAEQHAQKGEHFKVVRLLGGWPAPLAIFLRTPEGQMLMPDARLNIAKGLGLLGTACIKLGEQQQGEEVLRLAIQYGQEGTIAAEMYWRLGEAVLDDKRAGEAIAPLRRALHLGAPAQKLWPLLARAFVAREKHVAAFACVREAEAAGVSIDALANEMRAIETKLGAPLAAWRKLGTANKRA